MNTIFKQTVWALTKQVRAGKFEPRKFEVSFSELSDIGALKVYLDNDFRMTLGGRIDRIDRYDDGNKISIKVIDYKSGKTKFDLLRIYQGLQLQLVVYMDAAEELAKKDDPNREIVPGGILYYHIDDPEIASDLPLSEDEAEHALLAALKPDGLINSDESVYRAMDEDFETKSEVIPLELKKSGEISARSNVATTEEFELIRKYTRYKIKESSRLIYEGNIDINPYKDGKDTSCRFCPYQSVCGLDGKIPGFGFRHPKSPGKDEIFEEMETALML
jgi:ATP-dependent helicase/nuclease subunit B